jgi:integration host factor subunit beta
LQALQRKIPVSLYGFGTFQTAVTKARKARNPQTGADIEVPEKNRVKFAAFAALKNSVQENPLPKKIRKQVVKKPKEPAAPVKQ